MSQPGPGHISSLSQKDSDAILAYGRDIGAQLHNTIKMIGDFLDFLKDRSFRYSMFQELSCKFAEVPKPPILKS